MKQLHLRIFEELALAPSVEYINQCCEFCDDILRKLKPGICRKMEIDSDEITIGQEDWGWFLEFQKEEILYTLSISCFEKDEEGACNFGVAVEAERLQKGFLFDRHVTVEDEAEKLAEAFEAVAQENAMETFEEQ